MAETILFSLVLALVCVVVLAKHTVIVPEGHAYVVERLGRYVHTLKPGLGILVPFFDVVRYRHSLKEEAIAVPAQVCTTQDGVQVAIDGSVFVKVVDPERASYAVADYRAAVTQLARSTLETRIAATTHDRANAERASIASAVAAALDTAAAAWGVKVLRYEISHLERARAASAR